MEASTKRKPGRPKGSPNKKPRLIAELEVREMTATGQEQAPKRERARPQAYESAVSNGSMRSPRKPGRPKGSPNKKPRLTATEQVTDASQAPKRGRGRPKASTKRESAVSNGSMRSPRKPGRPKGSPNKKPRLIATAQVTDGSQAPKRGRGRPKGSFKKPPAPRGRPRKNPLPSPEELKKPKVRKPPGRPRKYPRVDPPEGDAHGAE